MRTPTLLMTCLLLSLPTACSLQHDVELGSRSASAGPTSQAVHLAQIHEARTVMNDRSWSRIPLHCMILALSACGGDPAVDGEGIDQVGQSCIADALSVFDCDATVEVRNQATGALISNEQTVVMPGAANQVGATADLVVSIRNVAAAASAVALRITNIEIVEPGTTGMPAVGYQCLTDDGEKSCADVSFAPVVPQGVSVDGTVSEQRLLIRFTRPDNASHSGVLRIHLGGSKAYKAQPFAVELRSDPPMPGLKVVPDSALLPYVALGATGTQALSVYDTGAAPLTIVGLDLLADSAWSVRLVDGDGVPGPAHAGGAPWQLDPPVIVPEGHAAHLEVSCTPNSTSASLGKLVVRSDDPAHPDGVSIPLACNTMVPCLKVEPGSLVDFGAVALGQCAKRTVRLRSCGSADLTIDSVALASPGGAFHLDWPAAHALAPGLLDDTKPEAGPSSDSPVTLVPNGVLDVPTTFCPAEALVDVTGEPAAQTMPLVVDSNATAVTVTLKGVGAVDVCPKAVVHVKEGEEVVPQTVLHLTCDQSSSPAGAIAKWHWASTQPYGAHHAFVPGPSFPNPTVTVNTAGTYTFCCEVVDVAGTPGCAPACVEVLVIPEKAIHIELLWSTPADPDETDKGPGAGADLDLHFSHPLAASADLDCDGAPDPWFSNPFDVFWFNAKPEWGSSNPAIDDNPSLDLDDTDGAGPENLNLCAPEGTVSKPVDYVIGVHYWDDHGYGTSYATVNVYLMGVLVLQEVDVPMQPYDMWTVGRITWPGSLGGGIEAPISQCMQTGDACLGKKDPSDPAGGKMWQPSGSHCMTPCYAPPGFPLGGGPLPQWCK